MTTPSVCLSGPEVRRLLDAGRVTLVRVVPTPKDPTALLQVFTNCDVRWATEEKVNRCPFGGVGTRLWCKEAFACNRTHNGPTFVYKADNPDPHRCLAHHWMPANRMLRRASRLAIETAAVRVKRCHDVTEDEALAMGIKAVDIGEIRPVYTWIDSALLACQGKYAAWRDNAWLWLGDARRVD